MTVDASRLASALGGRYRIERELGLGGMATVHLAQDLKHDRKVAIKILKPELAAVIASERFLAEIETTARLNHPNILALFDSGDASGLHHPRSTADKSIAVLPFEDMSPDHDNEYFGDGIAEEVIKRSPRRPPSRRSSRLHAEAQSARGSALPVRMFLDIICS